MSIVLLALPLHVPLSPAMPGLCPRSVEHLDCETSHPMTFVCTPAHCDHVASFPLGSSLWGFFALVESIDSNRIKRCEE